MKSKRPKAHAFHEALELWRGIVPPKADVAVIALPEVVYVGLVEVLAADELHDSIRLVRCFAQGEVEDVLALFLDPLLLARLCYQSFAAHNVLFCFLLDRGDSLEPCRPLSWVGQLRNEWFTRAYRLLSAEAFAVHSEVLQRNKRLQGHLVNWIALLRRNSIGDRLDRIRQAPLVIVQATGIL